jgi:hypothetical protein
MMMSLAREVGRNRAHDLVYEATAVARDRGIPIQVALAEVVGPDLPVAPITPAEYLGGSDLACRAAIGAWKLVSECPAAAAMVEQDSEKEE